MPFRIFKPSFIQAIRNGDLKTITEYIEEYRTKGILNQELHRFTEYPFIPCLPLYYASYGCYENYAVIILLLEAGTQPHCYNPNGCSPFERAIGDPLYTMLMFWFLDLDQNYKELKCSENSTLAQKIARNGLYQRETQEFIEKTEANIRDTRTYLAEANTLADSGNYETAAKKHEAAADNLNKLVKYIKNYPSYNDTRPVLRFFDDKRIASLNAAAMLYQKLLKKDAECLVPDSTAKQIQLLEKLADLHIDLGNSEQAIEYSRRSGYLKCGEVAPAIVSPSILSIPSAAEFNITESDHLLSSQPLHASRFLRQRHSRSSHKEP